MAGKGFVNHEIRTLQPVYRLVPRYICHPSDGDLPPVTISRSQADERWGLGGSVHRTSVASRYIRFPGDDVKRDGWGISRMIPAGDSSLPSFGIVLVWVI